MPFTMDSVSFTRFDAEHNVLAHVTYEGDEFSAAFVPGPEYLPGETMGFTVNQPADSSTHYGLTFGGTDASGNARTFRVLVPLSQEMLAAEKPDSFRASGEGAKFSDVCPYRDMMGYGYRFTATTEDGSTQTANCFYACIKEEKPE